ncbi:MAG TPA: glycoside hydrolase family 36 protein, partial [Anaerolineae bacterium]|nr:glycoside hydrolase family 36 protein [Anaerolineae bacterium]
MGARTVTHFRFHDGGTFDVLYGRHLFLARATARVTYTDALGVLHTLQARSVDNDTTLFARDENVQFQAQLVGDTITLNGKHIGTAPIHLESIQPLYCDTAAGGSIHLAPSSKLLYLHHGWQSWSQTAVRLLTAPEIPYSGDEFFQKHLPYGVAGIDARTSDSFMLIGNVGSEQAALIGFTSGARHLSQIHCTVHGERVATLSATAFSDGIRLDAGKPFETEPLVICFGDAGGLYDEYARRVAANMGRRGKRRTIQGWCSWYYYFGENTTEDVRANVRAINAANLPLDVILIDDGYETMIGDWTSIRAEKFPEGMRVIAEEIRASGKIPGIWLAPFGARHDSQLARTHPEFLLRDEFGNPVLAWTHWMQPVYALDLTRPEVQQWLRELFHIVSKEWGYQAFKLDFLFAGALAGKR